MEKIRPIVVSVSAVSGGGKTTVSKLLNDKLHNSKVLFFDDYDFEGPENIIHWVKNGANYDEWDLTPLIDDLQKLLSEPLDYILLDYPFAYKNSKMSNLIDFTVYIDTPLDIALVRRICRDFKDRHNDDILQDLENYISLGRLGYMEMIETVKPNSDFIVDGTMLVTDIVDSIYERVRKEN